MSTSAEKTMSSERSAYFTRVSVVFYALLFSFVIAYHGYYSGDDSSRELSEDVGEEHHHHHQHKPIFPLDQSDYVGTFLIIIGLMIAASGGIGGGGIIVPLLILVFGFSPKMAIPLSNFTILGSSLTNMLMNLSKRHPNTDRPLIDWNLIMVMEPLTVGGAVCGTFLSKVLPDLVLTIMLVVLLALTAHRTLTKGISQFKKEAQEFKESQRSALSKARDEVDEDEDASASQLLLEKDQNTGDKSTVKTSSLDIETQAQEDLDGLELAAILEQEKGTPHDKVLLLVVMFAVLITLNFLKGGGSSFPSPIGIECGGFYYWVVTFLIFAWVLAIAIYMRSQLIAMWRAKKRLRYKYVEGDVEWNERNTLIYPFLCIFAGFCAGMFGVGGGIVKGPLMLEMGVHPLVAAGTVAVMIFMTSISATTSYMAFGTLTYDYAYFLFCFGLVATAVGQLGVGYLVKKYKRMSLISLSIGAVIALSTLLMGFQSVLSLFGESNDDSNKLCT
jgi:uncharacterized membrane protein YfcA